MLKQTPVFQLFSPFQTILSVAAALLLFWGLVQFYNQNAQSPTALKHAAFESKIIHYKRLETPVIELLEQNKPERKSTENQPVFADNRITHKEIENANQIIEAQRKTEKIEILPMYEQQQLQTGIIAQAAPSLPDAKVDLIKKLHRINWSEENLEIARQMAKQKLNESIAPIVQEEKSIFWSVAEFSVDKISAATGRPMKFENTYDEEGKIKVLAFSSKNFGLTKNIY